MHTFQTFLITVSVLFVWFLRWGHSSKVVLMTRSNFEAAQPPILIDNGVAVLENEKIERHIMKNIPGGHNLFISDNVCLPQKFWFICHNCIPGGEQKDWECLLQVQAHAPQEGWHEQEFDDCNPDKVSTSDKISQKCHSCGHLDMSLVWLYFTILLYPGHLVCEYILSCWGERQECVCITS